MLRQNNTPVYFISGLGADCSAFDKIVLPEGYYKVYLEWEKSYLIEANIPSISKSFSNLIKEDNALVIGLSFGGMVLTEIAKSRPNIKAILLSSIPSKQYFPSIYKYLLQFRLHYAISKWHLTTLSPVFKKIMGNSQSSEVLDKTSAMLAAIDIQIFKKSIEAMRVWDNTIIPANIIQIHGNKDLILPKTHKIDYLVNKGSHFMVWENAKEVSKIINQILTN